MLNSDGSETVIRSFRRIQADMHGNQWVLFVTEKQVGGKTLFEYRDEEGRELRTENGRLNYTQFLQEVRGRHGFSKQ